MSSVRATLVALGLDERLDETLHHFSQLFLRWNRSINLSAARTERDLEEHLVDSLHVIPHLRAARLSPHEASSARVLDVGSGGGLPAVVAALCLPDVHVTALEPVHKKHAFLRTAARELRLANFEPLAERLEDHVVADYDAAMSRATFDLREWLQHGLARIRPGGIVLGFEAVLRTDLPPTVERHSYTLNGKARTIVILSKDI
jgi:16S rRNA (guanine527-N7)-methyltransferase